MFLFAPFSRRAYLGTAGGLPAVYTVDLNITVNEGVCGYAILPGRTRGGIAGS
jgi:hypothetical protein